MKKFIIAASTLAFAFVLAAGNVQAFTYSGYGLISQGSRGPQVMDLQTCLNRLNYTSGVVDGKFGPITKGAVMRFQVSNNVNDDGIIGPVTGPLYTAACNAASTPVVTAGTDTEVSTTSTSNTYTRNSGAGEEADFADVDVDEADDDTIEEGEEKAELATVEFELEVGGSAQLQRADIILNYIGGESADENDPWEVFDTIYLMVDGEVIAEKDADDSDEWEDENLEQRGSNADGDETRFRISGIEEVFEADAEHEITIAADIAGSLDLGSDEQAEWEFVLLSTGLRFIDEAGITIYLDEESTASTKNAQFTIEEEGQDDELDVRSSSNDPDSTTLKVEDDESSDDLTVFVFELEADDDSGDLDIDRVNIQVEIAATNTVNTNGAITTPAVGYDNVVKDEEITIDGQTFNDVDVTVAPLAAGKSVATLSFDVDEDFRLDSGETVEVELVLEFNSANGRNYNPGATVKASVLDYAAATANTPEQGIIAEGADDVYSDGTATGDVHTLQVQGINVERKSQSAVVQTNDNAMDDQVTFKLVLDITAFEEDAYITEIVADSFNYSITKSGVVVYDSDGALASQAGTAVAAIDGDVDQEGIYYRIDEDETGEFILSVTYNPYVSATGGAAAPNGGSYRLQLDSVEFNDVDSAPNAMYNTVPAQDYRTESRQVTA